MTDGDCFKALMPLSGVKAYETIVIMFSVYFSWHLFWGYGGRIAVNLEMVEWGCIALTIVAISKHYLRKSGTPFEVFMGQRPNMVNFSEIVAVAALVVGSGVGAWSFLVWSMAQFAHKWPIDHFHLTTYALFESIVFLKSWIVISILSSAVLAPISEEILFRGFVLQRLRMRNGDRNAILLSALIFAVFHFDMSFFGAFLHGIVYAVLAIRFSSLYIPILVHGIYNASVSLLRFGFGFSRAIDPAEIGSSHYWLPEFFLLAFTAASLAWYCHVSLKSSRFSFCRQHHRGST